MNIVDMVPRRRRKSYKLRRTEECDVRYRKLYRFNRENVKILADLFLDPTGESRGGRLSNLARMETLLRYLGDPGFQEGIGTDIGYSQGAVCYILREVSDKVVERRDRWIRYPSTVDEFVQAEQECAARFGRHHIPGTIGAVDGCLFKIRKPGDFGDFYLSGRKKIPCINVQATVNAVGLATSVDVSWPGSVHDARIWKNSDVLADHKRILGETSPFQELGDKAYGCTPYIMPPFKTNQVHVNRDRFNSNHKHERVMIEHLFGQLKARFPMLRGVIRLRTDRIPNFIMAGFVLFNVGKYLGDEDWEDVVEHQPQVGNDPDEEDDGASAGGRRRRGPSDARLKRLGTAKRNRIADAL